MSKTLFSAAEVAEILGLHQKTVQRFIREGKIKANKIGRSWKIHIDDLKEYSHAELTAPEGAGVAAKESSGTVERRVSVSAVIELRGAAEREISRVTNTIIAVLNGKDPSWGETRYDYFYQPETGTARFILYGSPMFISSIMRMLEPLLEEDGREA